MPSIEIAGIRLNPQPYTDSDIIALSGAAQNLDPLKHLETEKVAVAILRAIFPDMPPEWTMGDRLRPPLYRSTLAVVLTRLQELLMEDEEYQDTLEPLKTLPLDANSLAAIAQLEKQNGRSQHQTKPRPHKYGKNRY